MHEWRNNIRNASSIISLRIVKLQLQQNRTEVNKNITEEYYYFFRLNNL